MSQGPSNKKNKSKLSIAAAATVVGVSTHAPAALACQDITISSNQDDVTTAPVGSLREAVNTINAAGPCSTGDFFHSITIPASITSIELMGMLQTGYSTKIIGPGKDVLTVSASSSSSGDATFNVGGGDLQLSDFTISDMDRHIYAYTGHVTVDNMRFKDISYSSGSGGAIYIWNGNLTISNSNFENNSASYGGAINGYSTNVSITDSTFEGNSSTYYGGAANLHISGGDTVSITGSNFDNNTAGYGGGAIRLDASNSGGADISASSLTNNTASTREGGALYMHDTGGGTPLVVQIDNTTISGNSASTNGGGISLNSGSLDINSATIMNNDAPTGGGINSTTSGTIDLENSILAKNTASSAGPNASGTLDSISYTLIGDASAINITTQSNSTAGVSDSDLNMNALADNGGLGLTHLPNDCDVVNSGDTTSSLSTDQVGNTRVFGSNADLGALELQNALDCKTDDDKTDSDSSGGGGSGSLGAGIIAFITALSLFRRKYK